MENRRLALLVCGVVGCFALMLYGGYLAYRWWGPVPVLVAWVALFGLAWFFCRRAR